MSPSWISCFPQGTGTLDSKVNAHQAGVRTRLLAGQQPSLGVPHDYHPGGLIVLIAAVVIGLAGGATTSPTSARRPARTRQALRATARPSAVPIQAQTRIQAQTTAAGAACTYSGTGSLRGRPPDPQNR